MEQIVIEPSAELDIFTVLSMSDQIDDALTLRPNVLTLDLTRVTFIDCAGLSALLKTRKLCNEANVRLTLRCPGRAAVRLFELTSTGPLFTVEQPG